METIRFTITMPHKDRQEFARFLDREVEAGSVISWGETYHRLGGVFYITVPNGLAIWNLRGAWENIKAVTV